MNVTEQQTRRTHSDSTPELENIIEHAVVLSRGEQIVPEDLPTAVQGACGDRRVLAEEAEAIRPLLQKRLYLLSDDRVLSVEIYRLNYDIFFGGTG